MTIADLNGMEGRTFPARRRTRNIAGGSSPIRPEHFALGIVTLEPEGGQVPWHNQDQEELYLILEGSGQMCLGTECGELKQGQAVYIPPRTYHQLTNTGKTPMTMLYCYGPSGDVAHWKQELAGTLPRAGLEAPPLPPGAWPQCIETPRSGENGNG